MSTTLLAAASLFAPIHAFLGRLAKGSLLHRSSMPLAEPCPVRVPAGTSNACRVRPAPAPADTIRTTPTLRVLRVMEAGQPAAHGGRMLISGRMADVCAELDRMAAREAALRP